MFVTVAETFLRWAFIQPGDNLIDPARSDHAVLSQDPGEHLQNLRQTDWAPLNEAGDHADVFHDRLWPRWVFLRQRCGGYWNSLLPPLGILLPLLHLAILVPVIGGAPLVGLTLAMGLPTSERAAQVLTLGVPGVRQKEDPAVPTSLSAPAQLRLASNNRSQQHVVAEDQLDYRAAPIPIRGEPKVLPDLGCKKPKLRLWTLK